MAQEEKPILERASFVFTQEANCTSSADNETLTIEVESSLGIDRDGGGFFVLKTKQWSINDAEELKETINRIEKAIKTLVDEK